MKKRIFLTMPLLLLIASSSYAYDDGDFQVWNTEVEEFKINQDSKIALEEEFRWGDNAEEFYYHHYDAGFIYSLNENFDLSLNYRQVYEKKNGRFKEENRPHLNATLKGELFRFKLEDRNRLQYRHFDYQSDFWQYRNKFTVKFPWKFTKIELQPYLADEIFVDFQNKSFSRNRFYSGFIMNLTQNLKTEIYYLLQSNRSTNTWVESNVLGAKLKIAF